MSDRTAQNRRVKASVRRKVADKLAAATQEPQILNALNRTPDQRICAPHEFLTQLVWRQRPHVAAV